MSSVIIITKDGRMTELSVKEYSVDTLFRRAGFKQASGFGEKFRWRDNIDGEPCTVIAFGKTAGRALQKNSFRFPEAIAGSIGLQSESGSAGGAAPNAGGSRCGGREEDAAPQPSASGGDRPLFFGNIVLVAMAGGALLGLKKAAMAHAMASWILSSDPPPSPDAEGGLATETPRVASELTRLPCGAPPLASGRRVAPPALPGIASLRSPPIDPGSLRRSLEISTGADPSTTRPPQTHIGGASIRRSASRAAIVVDVKNCFDCSVELTEEAYI